MSEEGSSPGPAQRQVLLHTPGPRWDHDLPAGEEPGIEQCWPCACGRGRW